VLEHDGNVAGTCGAILMRNGTTTGITSCT
jgi:hypothetical protein